MCRVTILNENGIPVTVEVSREIYQVFVDYEREIERQRNTQHKKPCHSPKLTANMVSTTYRRYAAVQQPSGWKP